MPPFFLGGVKMKSMKINRESMVAMIAMVAHEINAAYASSIGDNSQPSWADAPDWQKASAVAGVNMHLDNPDATPEQSHESWLKQKTEDGWAYGEVKDADKKLHPCFLPYAELPVEQKSKDYLFRAVVHTLSTVIDQTYSQAIGDLQSSNAIKDIVKEQVEKIKSEIKKTKSKGSTKDSIDVVGVRYIGRKPTFKDRLYKSGITFEQGQERSLPPVLAGQLLRHVDMFERVESTGALDSETAEILAKSEKENEQLSVDAESAYAQKVHVSSMDNDALAEYALSKYGQTIKKNVKVETNRQTVIGLIDQFGVR